MKTQELSNGFVHIIPDKGKQLFNVNAEKYYSEAIVKKQKVNQFIEVDYEKE